MSDDRVLFEVDADHRIATITLNNPKQRNSYDAAMRDEIARCLDLAKQRGESGIEEQLSVFFKLPMTRCARPEQAFHKQESMLLDWLG